MARYVGAQCRLCRREGTKLFLKGARCNTEKCSFVKRPTPPGFHGGGMRKKSSYYSMQLREKQKTKRIYGMLEKQFRRFFRIATKAKGATGRTLLQLLERRLDNVLYRSLFAESRNQARQIVRHGFVFISGKRVSIPSYIVREGDEIELRVKKGITELANGNIESCAKARSVPSWLSVNNGEHKIKVMASPVKDDLAIDVNEQFIVELYSK